MATLHDVPDVVPFQATSKEIDVTAAAAHTFTATTEIEARLRYEAMAGPYTTAVVPRLWTGA